MQDNYIRAGREVRSNLDGAEHEEMKITQYWGKQVCRNVYLATELIYRV